jgi:DNA-damage-inducible protein D
MTRTQGFDESKTAARKGGEVAGTARKDLEKKTGKRVVSSGNYLTEPESRKRLKP